MLEAIKKKLYTENEYGYRYADLDARLSVKEIEYLHKEFGLRKGLHKMCTNCQARQYIKYKGYVREDGTSSEGFEVDCKGIPEHLPAGSSHAVRKLTTDKGLNSELARLIIKSTIDPVAWCELMFGFRDSRPKWHIRPHQKEILRCNAMRLVARWGRRSGKSFGIALKLLHMSQNVIVDKGTDSEGNQEISGPRIMVVTPYQSQLINIFNDLEMLVKKSSVLTTEIDSKSISALYTKTPNFKMKFKDRPGCAGSRISGFVSGTGARADSSDGGTIRGASAEIVYLDEMDMIPDDILTKVLEPILLTDEEGVILLGTSTPIGKRGKFYEWSKDSPEFKESYFPSTVLVQWEKFSKSLRETNTSEAFRSEYMAEFIEGSYGVFKPTLVHAARENYRYQDANEWRWWKDFAETPETSQLQKVIGIDWNKNAGSEFVVAAFDPGTGMIWIIEAINIPGSNYSAKTWRDEVLRLNAKHKPVQIYADEGYGHTIIEDLKLLSHSLKKEKYRNDFERQSAALVDRLVAFNFSQRIELKSPIDGTNIVKTGKEYLVENTIRILESGRLRFPEADSFLLRQMLGYVVLRRSLSTGKPVYGPDSERVGDHRLDALMLALAGLSLEFSSYAKGNIATSMPSLVNKGTLQKRTDGGQERSVAASFMEAWKKGGSGHVVLLNIDRQEHAEPSSHGTHKDEPLHTAWAKQHRNSERSAVRSRGRKIRKRR